MFFCVFYVLQTRHTLELCVIHNIFVRLHGILGTLRPVYVSVVESVRTLFVEIFFFVVDLFLKRLNRVFE